MGVHTDTAHTLNTLLALEWGRDTCVRLEVARMSEAVTVGGSVPKLQEPALRLPKYRLFQFELSQSAPRFPPMAGGDDLPSSNPLRSIQLSAPSRRGVAIHFSFHNISYSNLK